MSAKNVDKHNRFRSITVGFRVSGTEPSSSPVGTSKAGILLPQVYGA